MVTAACARMTPGQRHLWDVIPIKPEKWLQHPFGDLGGGFWPVAVLGKIVVWYNDIEDGFNRSRYSTYGTIGECWCNQDELEWTIQHLLEPIQEGEMGRYQAGPPQPLTS